LGKHISDCLEINEYVAQEDEEEMNAIDNELLGKNSPD
jgi:hypothetical protein